MKRIGLIITLLIATCGIGSAQSGIVKRAIDNSARCNCAVVVGDSVFYDGAVQIHYKHPADNTFLIYDRAGTNILRIRRVRFAQTVSQSIVLTEWMRPESPDSRAYSAQWMTIASITKTLMEAGVVKDGKLIEEGWAEYVKFHPSPTGKPLTEGETPVEAAKSSPDIDKELGLFVANGEVYHEKNLVAKYNTQEEKLATGSQTSHKIMNAAGETVALVKIPQGGALTSVFVTSMGAELKLESKNLGLIVYNLLAMGVL